MKEYIIHQDVCAQQFPKEHKTFFKEKYFSYNMTTVIRLLSLVIDKKL